MNKIEAMRKGGKILFEVKEKAKAMIKPGVTAYEIDKVVDDGIKARGASPSFKTVSGYDWATCVNVNEGVVHGIPKKSTVFKKGDLVSVDLGVLYKGFHTDSAFTVLLGSDNEKEKFLKIGRDAVSAGIKSAKVGNKIGDISRSIEKVLKSNGVNPIWSLTGHGVGEKLHEKPLIPNYVAGSKDEKVDIINGMTLAIEVMYTKGSGNVKLDDDGWTLYSDDGKITALLEETVAVTSDGSVILTNGK